ERPSRRVADHCWSRADPGARAGLDRLTLAGPVGHGPHGCVEHHRTGGGCGGRCWSGRIVSGRKLPERWPDAARLKQNPPTRRFGLVRALTVASPRGSRLIEPRSPGRCTRRTLMPGSEVNPEQLLSAARAGNVRARGRLLELYRNYLRLIARSLV